MSDVVEEGLMIEVVVQFFEEDGVEIGEVDCGGGFDGGSEGKLGEDAAGCGRLDREVEFLETGTVVGQVGEEGG